MSVNGGTEELRCGQCLKAYSDPRLLTCLHSFCMECLKDHVTKNNWKKNLLCPSCNKEMLIPKEGVSAIPKDTYLKARTNACKLTPASECETCQANKSAVSRCLDCDLNLCAECRVTHAPPSSEQVHNFIHFEAVKANDAKQEQSPSTQDVKLTQIQFCRKHETHERTIFCTKCNLTICSVCKEEKHTAHPVEAAVDVAKLMRSSLSHFLGAIKEYLPDFESYMKQIRKCQKEHDGDLQNAIADVQARCKFLQNEIEKISNAIIAELKDRHKSTGSDLSKEVKIVINSYKSISTVTASADRIIKIGSDENIIQSSKKLQKRFSQIEDELPKMSLEKIDTVGFVPGPLKADSLTKMFGQCTRGEITLPVLPEPWGIRVAKEFEMCSIAGFKVRNSPDTIQAIAPVSEQEAWLACGWGTKDVYLFTMTGERKKKITLDIQIDHLIMPPSGELLVSSYEDKYIRKLNKDHEVCDFAMPHLYPGGMVMTKRKELFVCAVDSYTTRRADHSHRCLLKMSEYGMNIDTIDEDGDVILFGAPYRVCEAPNRDLVVTDREEGKLRVTRVDQEGCLKYVYKGPAHVEMKQPFNPLGLCCDKAGNLLVSDWGITAFTSLITKGSFRDLYCLRKTDYLSRTPWPSINLGIFGSVTVMPQCAFISMENVNTEWRVK